MARGIPSRGSGWAFGPIVCVGRGSSAPSSKPQAFLMNYIRFCINNPVKVIVGVLLTVLFGLIALFAIPVQLTPNVDQPIITVTTNWVGRSPQEVEREIIEKQEDKLKSVSSLKKMTAAANQGRASMTLEFYVGTNMTRALQEVSDKLREVPSYPDDVDQPVIVAAESSSERAVAWITLTSTDPNEDVQALYDQVDKRVKPYLERVSGLSQINIYGGREREVHIQIDPRRLAERGITFNQLRAALQLENVNISAGDLAEGRLDVRIRTIGQYDNLDDVRQTIVTYDEAGGPVRVKDLGAVVLTLEKRRSFVRANGKNALAINAIRETGSNVMDVMAQVRQRLDEVQRDILPTISPNLRLHQVYDETVYIQDAIDLVTENLWQGGVLAIIVLLMFLGRGLTRLFMVPVLVALMVAMMLLPVGTLWWVLFTVMILCVLITLMISRATAIIGIAIPISIIGTFVALTAFGRNLNVISLAGLAFAVGMVVDNAIVVLENIDRHLRMNKTVVRAAFDGAAEVWSAILASTLTTLVVFLPVIFMQEEAGQLFRDISLAVCAAVALSLVAAITVVPAASSRWLKPHEDQLQDISHRADRLFGLTDVIGWLNERFADLIHFMLGSWVARIAIVSLFTVASIGGAYFLMPPTTYLPNGNQNLVFALMLTPPAYNIDQNATIGHRLETTLRPYWENDSYAELAKLPPVIDFKTQQPVKPPPINDFFFVTFGGNVFMGAASGDKENVQPLATLLNQSMMGIPGAFGFAQQASIFGRGLGGTNAVDVEVVGNDLTRIRQAADALYQAFTAKYGFGGVRPNPLNFNLAGPEKQIRVDRVQAADLGINVASLGLGVAALVDGTKVGDYRYEGDSINLLITRPPDFELTPDTLKEIPLAVFTPQAGMKSVPLSSVAVISDTEAPQQINRVEQRRAVTLSVVPPPSEPLEEATADIEATVAQLRKEGKIASDIDIQFAGTADKLVQVRETLLGKWYGFNLRSFESLITSRMFLALLINYLLMAALFESFLYPFVIMFSVPLATIGGFLGLRLVHTFVPTQLLDVVTMLGFVILIGTVVNNAILIVAQSLNFMRGFGESQQDKVQRMTPRQAIRESVRTRMRPVMMTTATTLFGLLPLVIKPGAGSEIYRGLGSVVLGGLLLSTIFTLLVVPLLLSLVIDAKTLAYRAVGWSVDEVEAA